MSNDAPASTLFLDANDRVVEAPVYTIPGYKLGQFQAKVDQANRRLQRAGIDARFEFSYEEFQQRTGYNAFLGVYSQPATYETWVNATLTTAFNLSLGDFTFIASLVAEEAGMTVHTAPGHELGGYEPAGDDHCDHCNVDRRRTRLYIVRNDTTGELLQLGHTCIELYTGFSPKGLWALQFADELKGFGEDDGVGGGWSSADRAASVNEVIALAFAYSNEGRNYVSSKVEWKRGTGAAVRTHIFQGAPLRRNYGRDEQSYQRDLAEYEAAVVDAARYLADEALIADIRASVETTAADSDYGRNLRVILAGEFVSSKNIGFAASVVSVYAREKELAVKRAQEAAKPKAQGFLAEVGTRIKKAFSIELSVVRQREGDFGWSTWVVGTTPEGFLVCWNASGKHDWTVGDVLKLEAASVKAHENYKGNDQTIITRAKIDDFEERAQRVLDAIEDNDGHDFEPIKTWVSADDATAGIYTGKGEWQVTSYDETRPLTDRWLSSKAEVKRFIAWREAQA